MHARLASTADNAPAALCCCHALPHQEAQGRRRAQILEPSSPAAPSRRVLTPASRTDSRGCAQILGSITLVVIRSDEQAGAYREQSNAMKQYSRLHGIPEVPAALTPPATAA